MQYITACRVRQIIEINQHHSTSIPFVCAFIPEPSGSSNETKKPPAKSCRGQTYLFDFIRIKN